jgi:hypothetical protein
MVSPPKAGDFIGDHHLPSEMPCPPATSNCFTAELFARYRQRGGIETIATIAAEGLSFYDQVVPTGAVKITGNEHLALRNQSAVCG